MFADMILVSIVVCQIIPALTCWYRAPPLDVWYIHTPETSSFSSSSHKKRDYNILYKKAVLTPHSGKICHLCEVSGELFNINRTAHIRGKKLCN